MIQRERTNFLKKGRRRIFEHNRRLERPSIKILHENDEPGLEKNNKLQVKKLKTKRPQKRKPAEKVGIIERGLERKGEEI